ncbi:hypothetical protein [Streptomyces sp. NPDC001205]
MPVQPVAGRPVPAAYATATSESRAPGRSDSKAGWGGTGPRRFRADRQRILRRLLCRGLLTDGLRLAADIGEWYQAHLAHPALDGLRTDWRRVVGHVVHAMAALAHQDACVVRASREALAAKATSLAGREVSVHQIKRGVRLLRHSHLLTTLEEGRAPGADHPCGSVPLYALTVPVVAEAALPCRAPDGRGRGQRERSMERARRVHRALGIPEIAEEDAGEGTAPQNRGFHHGGTTPLPPTTAGRDRHRDPLRAPRPRRGRVSPAARARYAARLLAREVPAGSAFDRIRPGQQAKLVAPFAAAGWSGADVAWALAHSPDAVEHTWSARVRRPLGWALVRLRLWLDPDGRPLPSRWEQLGGAPWQTRGRHGDLPGVRAQLPTAQTTPPLPGLLTSHSAWDESWDNEHATSSPATTPPNSAYLSARQTLADSLTRREGFPC